MPNNIEEFIHQLTMMHPVVGALLLGVGGVYLLLGWRIFKVLVIANACVLGMGAGVWVGTELLKYPNMDIIGGIAGGLLLAVAAWPLMRWAVSIMGALAGAAVGFGLWRYVAQAAGQPDLIRLSWVGALIGLITMGLLAFLIFKAVVIIFTSLQGSGMMVSGTCALLMKHDGLRTALTTNLTNNVYLLPLLVIVPTLIGVIFQETKFGKAHAGKK